MYAWNQLIDVHEIYLLMLEYSLPFVDDWCSSITECPLRFVCVPITHSGASMCTRFGIGTDRPSNDKEH